MSDPFGHGGGFGDFMGAFQEELRKRAGGKAAVPVPDTCVCSTQRELADWFTAFAAACRSNIPAETTP